MAANKGISNAKLKAALKSAAGIQSVAAEKLGTSRANISQRIRSSPDLQAWLLEIDQQIIDQAEANVVMALQERQPGTQKPTKEAVANSKWWLERKGRDRGFSTRTELANPDGSPLMPPAPVTINVRYVDAPGVRAAPREDVV